ncbi:hypothetical protein Plhal304r1_c070g0158821 [Plasmopara halstedii]
MQIFSSTYRDATTGCDAVKTYVLLAPLPTIEESVQFEPVTYNDILYDLEK